MPTLEEFVPVTDTSVRLALKQWTDSEAAIKNDEMLVRLFQKDYPGNDDLHGILVKSSALNRSTFAAHPPPFDGYVGKTKKHLRRRCFL